MNNNKQTLNDNRILIEINRLKKYYPVTKGVFRRVVGYVKAVDGVNFFVRKSETLGVVGESGCGKTTLGKCIVRLLTPTEGEIKYFHSDGQVKDLLKLNKEESFNMRKKIQIVFQDPYSSLNPIMTIFNSFDEPLKVHGMNNPGERKDRIAQLLEAVNLSPDYMYRYPHELSGGQRQRICIARALSINPEIIVCDEPVSALDVSIQAQVLNLMKDLQERLKLTYIFIAHDLSVVEYMSNRIAVMYLGKIVELADSSELYNDSRHPYTEALLSAVPVPTLEKKKHRIVLKGDVPSPENPPNGCRFHPRCEKRIKICQEVEPELKKVKGTNNHYVACHLAETE
ncbi:MAG: ATP-binding cassette domain-containing protein [Firmicutes bacterium]|nr:ATP-binding cassette domain-containing protein [Bacillota bacterium]